MLFEVHAGTIINLYAHLKILFATSFLKKASERNAGSTPLHLACLAGSSDVAEYLINHAADLHRSSDKKEATKKKADDLWYFVVIGRNIVTCRHDTQGRMIMACPRWTWRWKPPCARCWSWRVEVLRVVRLRRPQVFLSFFTKNKQHYERRRFFFQQSNFIKSSP